MCSDYFLNTVQRQTCMKVKLQTPCPKMNPTHRILNRFVADFDKLTISYECEPITGCKMFLGLGNKNLGRHNGG